MDPARYPPPAVCEGGDSLKMRTEPVSAATLQGGVSQTFPMVKLIDLDPIYLIPHQPTLVTEFWILSSVYTTSQERCEHYFNTANVTDLHSFCETPIILKW